MPCYVPDPTPEEIEESQRKSNEKKYGFYLSNHQLVAHLLNMCCEMGNALTKHNEGFQWNYVSEETYNWFVMHQKRDTEIKKKELRLELNRMLDMETGALMSLTEIKASIDKLRTEMNELH